MTLTRVHDIASLTFLAPFSIMCISEVFFGYVVYPLFLTHTLFMYMSLDLVWNVLNPHSYRDLILCHHIVCLLALSRAMMYPEEAFIVSLGGLVEIDTSLLTLRRLLTRSSFVHEIVDIFVGKCKSNHPIKINPNEVLETKWLSLNQLRNDIKKCPEMYTAWIKIYMKLYANEIFQETDFL